MGYNGEVSGSFRLKVANTEKVESMQEQLEDALKKVFWTNQHISFDEYDNELSGHIWAEGPFSETFTESRIRELHTLVPEITLELTREGEEGHEDVTKYELEDGQLTVMRPRIEFIADLPVNL